MAQNSETLMLKSFSMKRASSMNFQLHPQQNGLVERKNRTLIEMERTMLDEYKTQDIFWAEAINTACHAINHLYLHKFHKKTFYELIIGKKPNVSYFRVLGANVSF
jgi:hypothetical protein